MESAGSRASSTPMVLGIIGGLLITVGIFLNWVTAGFDLDAIAAALGIDPSQIPSEFGAREALNGWDFQAGKWMLVVGVVIVTASVLLVVASSRKAVAIVIIFGGAVGGSMALYKATAGKDGMIDEVAKALTGSSLPPAVSGFVSVSIGIGLWMCVAGGVVAVVAGIMAIMSQQPVAAMAGDPAGFVPPPPSDGGFAAGGAWTGMPETTGITPEASEPAPVTGDTMSEVESAMPEADMSKEPDAGSGTGVPAPPDDPPATS